MASGRLRGIALTQQIHQMRHFESIPCGGVSVALEKEFCCSRCGGLYDHRGDCDALRLAGSRPVNTANDRQVGGDHYRMAIQPWDVIDEWGLGFLDGNALKYIARWRRPGKNGLEDLRKAQHYLEKLIERVEKKRGGVPS